MTEEERKLIAGIYRRLGELTDALRKFSAKPAPATTEPTQAVLDLEPGTIAKEIAAKPHEWCNTEKVYEAIWEHFGKDGRTFALADLIRNEDFLADVCEATKNRVRPESLSKMLSVTTRAGATYTIRKGVYRCCQPTEERRVAVELVAQKRKEVAA